MGLCPWNRKAARSCEPRFSAREEWTNPDLIDWLERDQRQWTALLKGTALKRAKRGGLVRNAALVLGQRRLLEAVPALAARLDDMTEDPTVRAAAAWALGRMNTASSAACLQRNANDNDTTVCDAVRQAIRISEVAGVGAGD
jgi:epoxyqueuosine reductase